MYKIALCDDNKEYVEYIAEKVKKYGVANSINFSVRTFQDSETLLEWIEEKKLFDVYFLDIEMPFHSGIELAQKIRESSNTAMIIFLTAYDSFAIDACGMNVIRYLLKDRVKYDLEKVLDELIIRLAQILSDKIYVIANQRKYLKLMQREIIYIYKHQKNAFFVMKDRTEVKERLSLEEVYQKLESPDMKWLDRGIILNIHHIKQVVGRKVIMTDDHEIVTTASHTMELKMVLNEYWGNLL